jgi:hypothetical protein
MLLILICRQAVERKMKMKREKKKVRKRNEGKPW